MKRLFDFLISLITIIIFFLPIVIISVLIYLRMGSPILFKQKRPGKDGKPFYIYKFRTMTDETDNEGNLLPGNERVTKIGNVLRRLSLDELPQLFNVLKGEISLVGPRPLLMDYLNHYDHEQARRHEVKPGITGWAQVNGRNAITWEQKFNYDVWYVDNQSFLLDLKIILLTITKVIKSDGVNKSEEVTMDRFRGTGTDD